MNLPDEIVNKICKNSNTIDFNISDKLNKAAKTYEAISRFQQRLVDLEKQYKKDIQNLKSLIVVEQKTCSHIWKYYPDPSGNNGSCNVCLICDKME